MSTSPTHRVALSGPWGGEPVVVPWGIHPFELAIELWGSSNLRLGAVHTNGPTEMEIGLEASATEARWLPTNPQRISPGPDHRVRFAAYCVAERAGELLLTQLCEDQPDGGLWVLPGGGIDAGESPEEAMRREFTEETGLPVQNPQLVTVDAEVFPPAAGRTSIFYIRVLYRGTAAGRPRVVKLGDSTADAAWWPQQQLPPTNSVIPRALELLSDG